MVKRVKEPLVRQNLASTRAGHIGWVPLKYGCCLDPLVSMYYSQWGLKMKVQKRYPTTEKVVGLFFLVTHNSPKNK